MELSITLASEKNKLVFHVIQKMLTELSLRLKAFSYQSL